MYSSGAAAGSRQPRHHSSRRSSHHERERTKKRSKESVREKIDPFFATSPGNDDDHAVGESPTSEIPRGGGGGFEMGVVSGSMMTDEDSSNWFLHDNSSLQTTPFAPPTYMSISTTALATPMNECEVPLMGKVEGENKMEPQVTLWHKGWKAGPISCAIPKLHEPTPPLTKTTVDSASISQALEFPCDGDGNNLILHCIALQAYIQELRELLSSLPEESIMDSSCLDSLPKKPTQYQNPNSKLIPADPLHIPAKIPTMNLDKKTLGKLQRKSTSAVCSFSGYECSSPEALDVLSDLLGSFLANFTKFLKMNTDRNSGRAREGCLGFHSGRTREGCLGFHDALERSLHQVGVEGKAGLREYWQTSVVSNARELEMEADEYRNAYLRLTVPEEKLQTSLSADSSLHLSTPFVDSRLFSDSPQDSPPTISEEMSVDLIIQQSKTRAPAPFTVPYSTPHTPPIPTDPNIIPPEQEGFVQLEINEPSRKRPRTASIDE